MKTAHINRAWLAVAILACLLVALGIVWADSRSPYDASAATARPAAMSIPF